MLRTPTFALSWGMRHRHTAAVALVAAAAVTSSLVGVSSATAAASGARPVVRSEPIVYFSPNGDHVKDKVRIAFTLAKKSEVTVKVRRTDRTKPVLRRELGRVTRGTHTWRWNGRNDNGRIVRDGQYRVVFVADQVAETGKSGRDSSDVHVDTVYDPPGLTTNATAVYPLTQVITDQIGFRHGVLGVTEEERAARVELRITNMANEVVYTEAGPYGDRSLVLQGQGPGRDYPITWDGRDNVGQALPAGKYMAYLDAVDLAGNAGTAGWAYVNVSGVPLVETTGTVTVPPTHLYPAAASTGARVADGRAATTGGDDFWPVPCGSVVASTVYPDAGAMSYRSSDACGGTALRPSTATARGRVDLNPVGAQRGISSVQVAMRGKPTVDGETDTAQLLVGMYSPQGTPVTSAAVAGESVTTNTFVGPAWNATRERLAASATWSISTLGVDSYDVADVTLTYTYLAPQQ